MMYTPRNAGGIKDPATVSEFQYLSSVLNAEEAQAAVAGGMATATLNASRLLGRGSSAGSGASEELLIGSGLTLSGTTLTVSHFTTGSWTPTDGSGAALSFAASEGRYARIGSMVIAVGTVTYPATANASAAVLAGLPATSQTTSSRLASGLVVTDAGTAVGYQVNTNASTLRIVSPTALTTIANSALSGKVLSFTVIYLAA